MASRTYLNNREFTPAINSDHLVLRGVAEGGLPSLLGYVGASQKEMARVLLSSDEDDPILTIWQYGLGKTAAWNSDVSGKWSANYISWDRNIKLWQNIINFTLENYDDNSAAMEVEAKDNRATITFKDKVNKEELETKATVVTPTGESKEIKLYPSAPGEYSAEFDLDDSGIYMINGKQQRAGEVISAVNTGYAMQYSPEYRINNSSEAFDKLMEGIGGKFISSPEEVFSGNINSRKGSRDLTPFLLSLALILFIFDVAVRRLRLSKDKIARILERIKSLLPSVKLKRMVPVKVHADEKSANKGTVINTYNAYEDPLLKEQADIELNYDEVNKENRIPKVKEETTEKDTRALDTSKLLKNKKYKR
jgi:hypothetical protein